MSQLPNNNGPNNGNGYLSYGTQPIAPSDGINNYPRREALPNQHRIYNRFVPGHNGTNHLRALGMNRPSCYDPSRFPSNIVRPIHYPVRLHLNATINPRNNMNNFPIREPAAAVPSPSYREGKYYSTLPSRNTIGPRNGINNYPRGAPLPTLQGINYRTVPGYNGGHHFTSAMGMNQQRYYAPNRFPSNVASPNYPVNSLGSMDNVRGGVNATSNDATAAAAAPGADHFGPYRNCTCIQCMHQQFNIHQFHQVRINLSPNLAEKLKIAAATGVLKL